MVPYTMTEVLTVNGIHIDGNRNSIRVICPFCSGKKINKDMGITLDSEKFHCYSCGVSGRGATQFHALLNNMSTKDAYSDLCQALGYTGSNSTPIQRQQRTITHTNHETADESKEASADIKNNTYQHMLECLKLSEKHQQDLINRGFNELEIQSLGYVSYPEMKKDEITQEYFNIPKKLLDKNCILNGVPGFYKTQNKGVWTMCKRKGGILVPYRSFHNEIQSIQLRKNDEDLYKDAETGESENKYSWISSNGYKEGCKATTAVHYACDFLWNQDKQEFYPMVPGKKILLTEGAMKGDLAHAISGLPLICLPGVSSAYEAIRANIPLLKSVGVDTIVNAYDMDRVMNINVSEALTKIKNIVEEADMKTEEIYWSVEMVDLKGKHFKMNVLSTFVFTPETLGDALSVDRIDKVTDILQRAKKIGKTKIIFALPDSKAITKENKENAAILIEKCKNQGLSCEAAFWKLHLKGIDDYFAHKQRGINYIEQ